MPKPLHSRLYRYEIRREFVAEVPTYQTIVASATNVSALLGPLMEGQDKEQFVVLILDGRNKVKAFETVSIGSLNASIVHPRETFRLAVLHAAAAIVVAHNHPSGDPTPSTEDRRITERLRRAGEVLGITVLDHVVLGANGRFYSFADQGWPV